MAEEVILSKIQMLESCQLLDSPEKGSLNEFAKELVERMKNELMLILDFLRDSACSRNKLLSYLIADVVELAHDVQDYNIRNMGSNSCSRIKFDMIIHSLRKLKEWMLQLRGEGGQGTEPPLTSPNVVGLEGTVETLLRKVILCEQDSTSLSDNQPHTYYIKGVTGIGKTTLAKELYNHADVVACFGYRAWVCASGIISSKEILMKLILQVGKDEGYELLEEMDIGSLQQMLRQLLLKLNKPYFIVFDDAEEDAPYLISLRKALPKDKVSKLLITSPNPYQRFMPDDHVHMMEFLDDDKSWELFLRTTKTSEAEFPKQLKRRARKMLKQCSGLPLAIVEVGTQLAQKRESGIEWEELVESPVDLSQTLAALESTYHQLSPEEKSVFRCLSFFEEDTIIRVEKLLQIGIMTELVVNESEGRMALYELKSISFIEMENKYLVSRYDLKSFYLRIIFHRLSVARAEEEINFEILRNNGKNPSSRKICHRVIYCSRQKFNYSTDQDKHLVSLFFRGGGNFNVSPCYLERFEWLIILDIEGFGLKMVPETIGMLIKLRYLGLRNNHIQKLPDTLSCLKSLEVLDIAFNFMVEVPCIIWELDSLRHLYMSDIIIQGPLKMDALENIETLTYISIDSWAYELPGLQMMNKLRKLGIEGLDEKSDVSKLFESLAQLENLRRLTLRGFRFKRMPLLEEIGTLCGLREIKLDGLLTRLPSAKNFPSNLNVLTLVNSCLDEDPMPALEKLHGLEQLRLQNAYTGQQMSISLDGFKYLDLLVIKEFRHLHNLQFGVVAMPYLHHLEIIDCPYLYRIHLKHCLFLEERPEIMSQLKNYEIV